MAPDPDAISRYLTLLVCRRDSIILRWLYTVDLVRLRFQIQLLLTDRARSSGRESIAHPAFSIIPTIDLARYHLPRIQDYEYPFHVFRSRVSVDVPAA